jgi:hypothetical protein
MCKRAKQACLLLKLCRGTRELLVIQMALTHLFNGDPPLTKMRIHGFIDGPHAASASLANNHIALLEENLGS